MEWMNICNCDKFSGEKEKAWAREMKTGRTECKRKRSWGRVGSIEKRR